MRGSSPDALSDVAVLFLCLGAIRDRIEEVMNAFDALCEAAGRAPPFELAFQLLDAPRLVQWEVRQRLEGKPHPLYSPSHPPLNRYEQ